MHTRLASRLMTAPRFVLCVESTTVAAVAAVAGVAVAVALRLDAAGAVRVDRAFATMGFGAAVAATILLGLAAWLSSSGRAARIALAVAVYSTVCLSTTIGLDGVPGPAVLGDVSLLAVLVLLGSALRRDDVRPRGWHVATGAACLIAPAAVLVILARQGVLGTALPDALGAVIDGVGVVVAVAVLLSGVAGDRPLLRRVGLAFVAVTVGRLGARLDASPGAEQPLLSSVSELVGVVSLLLAAVPFAISTVSALWNQHEEWQCRLAEAEAAAVAAARRDHEMRNLVLGLTGATTAIGARIDSPTGRHLHAAASAELQRLRLMLDDGPIGTAQPLPRASVGAVLHDLAAMHRAGGADVEVRADGDLCALIDGQALAQVITNLLVNCARHAPGAPVELRARRLGRLIRVEVVDAGPGLPCGTVPETLLRSGVRGAASPGRGWGLNISVELVRRHGGAIRLTSSRPGPGCTVELDLVAADVFARVTEPVGR